MRKALIPPHCLKASFPNAATMIIKFNMIFRRTSSVQTTPWTSTASEAALVGITPELSTSGIRLDEQGGDCPGHSQHGVWWYR
jgi:hypothetical protein